MNRLLARTSARKKGEKLFCAFLTLGYPDLKTTRSLIRHFEKTGVDILELGFPFSDPLADGPTIQYASEEALKKGVCLRDAFSLLKELRSEGLRMPVVFFSYFNPIYHHGLKRFASEAKKSGFDGVIIPDLPFGSEKEFEDVLAKEGLSHIYLIAPTTSPERTRALARKSQGFVYYVSLRGVTGARRAVPSEISGHLKQIKKTAGKPVLVGFGVSTPEQASRLSRFADGVIVGSAIIDRLRKSQGKPLAVIRYIRRMVAAVKGSRHAGAPRH